MDTHLLSLAIPVFALLYAGMGMALNSRRRSLPFISTTPTSFQKKSTPSLANQIGHMEINQAILGLKGFRSQLDLLLLRSGFPYGWKAEDLLFYKELCVVMAMTLLWLLDMRDPFLAPIGVVSSFWALDLLLRSKGRARTADMQRNLPVLVDLLALALESGMDLLVAMERILEKMKPGAMRDELQVLMQESRLGSSRKEVLLRWAHRTGLADVQSLSSLIIQSEEMGSPLGTVLRNYAEDMRSRRMVRAEELAGKIPVKILMPMFIFFFPIVLVIILGPIALEFTKGYK